ncbi:hypothetical protein Nmel_001732 [Mimus melanotis]
MAAYLTHQQKVLRLYKKSLRHLESWCIHRDKYRYFACLLRDRFDKNKDVKDMVKATELLKAGEQEFWANQHPQPYIFADSPGGIAYERYEMYKIPEWCLDFWHPSEKAMYPDYFAKREQWKKLQQESWEREGSQHLCCFKKRVLKACEELLVTYGNRSLLLTAGKLGLDLELSVSFQSSTIQQQIPEWCLDFWHPSEKAMYPDYFAKREQWKKLQQESWEREIKQLQEETPADGPRTEALPPARKEGHLPPMWWQHVTRPREQPM